MPLSLQPGHSFGIVTALGLAQTLAWASSYYLPAILAQPMARELGMGVPTVFALYSLALLATAALGPVAGRAIDRLGGRPVLLASNLTFALGLLLLGLADGLLTLGLAWLVIGLAMSFGLYEAAFATLVRLKGAHARASITGVTLFAGFASTVGWPLSTWLTHQWDWRVACFTWAVLHLLVGAPLNASLPRAGPGSQGVTGAAAAEAPAARPASSGASVPPMDPAQARRVTWLLSFVFAATWFTSTAMASHLPRLLEAGGVALTAAIGVAALVGPAQVAGRLLEFSLLRRLHPLLSARVAAATHPLGAGAFLLLGPVAALPFALLHGSGNGIMTIAKGTLPLVLFGPLAYGERQGWLMVPTRFAQAAAPWLFGLCLDRYGTPALWLTAGLGLLASWALWTLRTMARPPSVAGSVPGSLASRE